MERNNNIIERLEKSQRAKPERFDNAIERGELDKDIGKLLKKISKRCDVSIFYKPVIIPESKKESVTFQLEISGTFNSMSKDN